MCVVNIFGFLVLYFDFMYIFEMDLTLVAQAGPDVPSSSALLPLV